MSLLLLFQVPFHSCSKRGVCFPSFRPSLPLSGHPLAGARAHGRPHPVRGPAARSGTPREEGAPAALYSGRGSSRREVGGEGGSSMFARGSAGAANPILRVARAFLRSARAPRRVARSPACSGAEYLLDCRGSGVGRPGGSEASGWNLSRPRSPPANTALPPPPESLTTAGRRRPRLPGARSPAPPSLPAESNPPGGCRTRPACSAEKDRRPGSL